LRGWFTSKGGGEEVEVEVGGKPEEGRRRLDYDTEKEEDERGVNSIRPGPT
jgi:hypothetical protein